MCVIFMTGLSIKHSTPYIYNIEVSNFLRGALLKLSMG